MAAQSTSQAPPAYRRARVTVEVSGGKNGRPQVLLQNVLLNDEPLVCHSVSYKIAAGELAEVTLVLYPEHFEVVTV